jgi:hypothetical protein
MLFARSAMLVLLAGGLGEGGQPPGPGYLVTRDPIEAGAGPAKCVAVNPALPDGVWWWQPGRSGCSTRSTGPDVFRADGAVVRQSSPGLVHVSFQTQLITGAGGPSVVVIDLDFDGESVHALQSGARVPMARWTELRVPERCCSLSGAGGV